jgi:hypothetical protein
VGSLFDVPADVKILPLTGISLAYEPGEVASCRVDARIQRLPAAYRDAVLAEAERVSRQVVEDDDQPWRGASAPSAAARIWRASSRSRAAADVAPAVSPVMASRNARFDQA